ncbi:MAG: GNAT superfamily N-acetyltransferase [Natronomonas sp.]|jgi:GNAT superfamily N-acetyltransferase
MTTVRQARADDHADVAGFTEGTWPDREAEDYVPDVFEEWVATDGPGQHTAVVEVADGASTRVVAVCQASLLADDEGWLQGIRVDPDHRGAGHGAALVEHLFEWLGGQGARVARNLVFDWNSAGMGQSRAVGFEVSAGCRFLRLAAAEQGVGVEVSHDPGRAWHCWSHSDARTALSGLALADEESWAFTELTRERVAAASPLALLGDGRRARATAVRLGTRDPDHHEGVVADYAAAAWEPGAGATLFDAVRADAARAGADEARVCAPATPRHVASAGAARASLDQGGLVFATDL